MFQYRHFAALQPIGRDKVPQLYEFFILSA
jgi:hypothetical protein